MKRTSFSPAMRLLVACAQWPRSQERNAYIAHAASELDTWPAFIHIVERHRMAALAYDGIHSAGITLPTEIYAALAQAARRDVSQVMTSIPETLAIATSFDRAAIPMVVVKGVPLSMEAFGEVALRQSYDLDLLVEPATFLHARALLIASGYEQVFPIGMTSDMAVSRWLRFLKDVTLRSKEGRLVELHQRLTVNAHIWPRSSDLADRAFISFAGGTLAILPDADRLLYLCLHGANHGWVRLKWLADIAALLAGKDDAAIEALFAQGQAAGLALPVGQALLLVESVFARRLPDRLSRQLHRHRRLRLLTAIGRRMLAEPREEAALRFASTQILISRLLIGHGWRYLFVEIRNALVDWPLVFAFGGSRAAIGASIALRPATWILSKIPSRFRY